MPGLKLWEPSFRFSGNKVTPDERDEILVFNIDNPSVSPSWFGTAANAAATAVTLTNVMADYPRTVLFTMTGVAGGMGGTATISGINQFGATISETISFGSAAGGGSVAGSLIFAQVTGATVTPVGLGGTAVGTTSLGVAIGTATTNAAAFGLPWRIRLVSDVKSITWINNGTATAINGGTVTSTFASTVNHSFMGSSIVAITDTYSVRVKPTYDSSNLAAVV